jgi:hypothetical protein
VGDEDRRPTLVERRCRRRGVLVKARAGGGRRDSCLSTGGQRHRGARDPAALEERGGWRPPPRSGAGERSVDEHDSHAKNVTRTGSYVKTTGIGRRPQPEPRAALLEVCT